MNGRKLSLFVVLTILLYTGVYIVNSYFGGYWPVPVAGNYEWAQSGWPLHTAILWQPHFGYADRFNRSALGYIFYPAIECDRRFFHNTLDVFDDAIWAPETKWHPIAKRMEQEQALRLARIVRDPEFLLSEASKGLSSKDRHLIALLLLDRYGCDALSVIGQREWSAKTESEKRAWSMLFREFVEIEQKLFTDFMSRVSDGPPPQEAK
jgi:hypothetical protein